MMMEYSLESLCAHHRVIVHVDFDCFYAQVEIMKNTALRNKPVGVRQKNILVTCNYLARESGVKKLMLLKTAQELCPDLVIVPGEDLTDYREVSYKVSRHLQEMFPLVEKLGLDENYIDVSDEVTKRIAENEGCIFEAVGHVFRDSDNRYSDKLDERCSGKCKQRLNLGSIIAHEIRDSILNAFQLTACAGIGHNKLLAKLACSYKKPNQQTLLYPEDVMPFLHSLSAVSRIPGIGPSTCKKLASHSIETVSQLQDYPLDKLESILGKELGILIQNLSRGIDLSPVVPFGKPLSLGLEDSFRKGATEEDCKKKIYKMIVKLLERIKEDGRTPSTIRLVLRKGSSSRESRQCPLPYDIFKAACSRTGKGLQKLHSILWSFFEKLLLTSDVSHVTLIGVTFTKLLEPEKTSIDKYLKRPSSSTLSPLSDAKRIRDDRIPASIDADVFSELPDELKSELLEDWSKGSSSLKTNVVQVEEVPHNIDSQVFMELPDVIKDELRQKWKKSNSPKQGKRNSITDYFSKKS